MLIQLNNVSKSYGNKIILDNLHIELHDGDITGIIGKNGEGKTTLLKIISGEILPDSGTISLFPNDLNVVYHQQFIPIENPHQTIEDYVISLYPDLYSLYYAINLLTDKTDEVSIQKSINLQSEFGERGGYDILGKIDELLAQLGMSFVKSEMLLSNLSGGQKTRLQFIKLLLKSADILLLDEPTNHLDVEGTKWLEDYLSKRNGITIIVSHDRSFLNSITNKIFEMDEGKYMLFGGNYDHYKEQKETKEMSDFLLYKSKMKEINRLSAEAQKKQSEARTTDSKFNRGWEGPVVRKKAGLKAKTAQILLNKIENQIKENMPDKPRKKDNIKLDLQPAENSGQMVCKIYNLNFSYDERNILSNFNLEFWQKDRIAFIGPNGSGKSTLLKLIAQELIPDDGYIKLGENVNLGYFSQEHEILDEQNTVMEEFRKYVQMTEQDARTFLYFMLFSGNQVFHKINTLSQGEKSKLMLAILLNQGANFLILDEPTNHLDIPSREALEKALEKYTGTLCVVSHDKYFLENIRISEYVELKNNA